MDPNSANAKQANIEITAPNTHTRKNRTGLGRGVAISFAVKKMDDPIMPLTSNKTESSSVNPRTRLGLSLVSTGSLVVGSSMAYPIPSSSGDSSALPQRRQITAEQSPQ